MSKDQKKERVEQMAAIQKELEALSKETPSVADAVEMHGGAAAYSEAWEAAGFDAKQTAAWLEAANCFNVESAARLCAAGVTPPEAAKKRRVGLILGPLGILVSTGRVSSEEAVEVVMQERQVKQAEFLQSRVAARLNAPVRLREPGFTLGDGSLVDAILAVLEGLIGYLG